MARKITINRAPVLTLWGVVVARRLGFRKDEALTLGKAVAGLNAYSKGRRLGLYEPKPKEVRDKRKSLRPGQQVKVDLMGRAVPCRRTDDGLRALNKDRTVEPESVERYLEGKFGDDLDAVRQAMENLAGSIPPRKLADRAFGLYERFRPAVPSGTKGWGAKGKLDLGKLKALKSGG